MPLAALLVVFVVVPLAELYVILKVGDAIGVALTVLLLAADSVLGAVLMRSQGRAVWRRFNEAMAAGRMPHREVQDGALVIFGGAFLITPGFLTDVVGLLLLIPPTRAVARRLIARLLARRVAAGVTLWGARRAEHRGRRPGDGRDDGGHGRGHYDVEGSATEYESPPPPLER